MNFIRYNYNKYGFYIYSIAYYNELNQMELETNLKDFVFLYQNKTLQILITINDSNDSLDFLLERLKLYPEIKSIISYHYGEENSIISFKEFKNIISNDTNKNFFGYYTYNFDNYEYENKKINLNYSVWKKEIKRYAENYKLTKREYEVLEKIICYNSNTDEIGKILNLNKRTIEKYLQNIYYKFKVNSRRELKEKIFNKIL